MAQHRESGHQPGSQLFEMMLPRRLVFNLWYLSKPPWETGIVPPEVMEFIESNLAGRALDLGCGSGTSSLALARAGWTVRGVDFASLAIRKARQKVRSTGLTVDFQLGNVTRLPHNLFDQSYDLVLDIGCFHSLNQQEREHYLDDLERLLAPDGTWLMYGFFKPEEHAGPGLSFDEPERIARRFKLSWRKDGLERNERPSSWFCFKTNLR